ncbi:MAG: cation:proton antiporter [Alphaproteobacteria bacterium]|nr:cation:proton antiporter [Alphaproteobacteria bacterium]
MHNFSQLLIVLGIAGLTVPFLHRFRITPVLGYLLCGVLIAPNGPLAWIDREVAGSAADAAGTITMPEDALQKFAELGIVFLMFMIGLKLSINELWDRRREVIGIGGAQVVATSLVIFTFARVFGNGIEVSILMAACLSFSSTAVVMQLLEEKKSEGSAAGKLCFSILLMQDLMVVPVLAMVSAFATNEGDDLLLPIIKALVIGVCAIALIFVIGMRLLPPLLRIVKPHRRREWLMSFVLFIVIGSAMLTEYAGLSAALGAFLAGLLLAETEYRKDVEDIVAPVKGLLMGVFFLSVGLGVDLHEVAEDIGWLLASVIGIGVAKAAILFAVARGFGVQKHAAAETAVMLGQCGEFAFVILTLALAEGVIPRGDAQFFMLVTALSMFVTPFVTALAPKLGKLLKR